MSDHSDEDTEAEETAEESESEPEIEARSEADMAVIRIDRFTFLLSTYLTKVSFVFPMQNASNFWMTFAMSFLSS
jgi:heme/copper-type cytochrome/quinol oxidase subunit 4